MRAYIEKTVDGINVILDGKTENIDLYMSNLGGIERAGKTFFWSRDAKWVPESLRDEGYSLHFSEQSPE